MRKDIPVFAVDFTDDSVWNSISIVDFPAIEEDFIKLSKQGEVRLSVNEEKRDIMGPVIITDQLIYRNDEHGEYYLKFSAETIKKMVMEFFKRGTQNTGNIMHMTDFEGVTFYQSMIKDASRGISPAGFEDIPDGSWFVTAHVDNDRVWEMIKKGELRGFSIDCTAAFVPEERKMDTIQDLMDYLNE